MPPVPDNREGETPAEGQVQAQGQGQIQGHGGQQVNSDRERLVPSDGDDDDDQSGDFEANSTRDNWPGVEGMDPHVFQRLKTLPPAMLGVLSAFTMVCMVFILPVVCQGQSPDRHPVNKCKILPFSVLVYGHAVHFVIHFFIDQYLKRQHKKSRLLGYISFYLTTKNMRRTPFYLVSAMNAVLLVTVTILRDYSDPKSESEGREMEVDYLRVLITLEGMVILCCWGYYAKHVTDFHKAKPKPDVLNEEVMNKMLKDDLADTDSLAFPVNRPAVHPFTPSNVIRRKDEILEKQAELIRYLASHIEGQNVMLLQARHHVMAARRRSRDLAQGQGQAQGQAQGQGQQENEDNSQPSEVVSHA